jgi:hypothetical protein
MRHVARADVTCSFDHIAKGRVDQRLLERDLATRAEASLVAADRLVVLVHISGHRGDLA